MGKTHQSRDTVLAYNRSPVTDSVLLPDSILLPPFGSARHILLLEYLIHSSPLTPGSAYQQRSPEKQKIRRLSSQVMDIESNETLWPMFLSLGAWRLG